MLTLEGVGRTRKPVCMSSNFGPVRTQQLSSSLNLLLVFESGYMNRQNSLNCINVDLIRDHLLLNFGCILLFVKIAAHEGFHKLTLRIVDYTLLRNGILRIIRTKLKTNTRPTLSI